MQIGYTIRDSYLRPYLYQLKSGGYRRLVTRFLTRILRLGNRRWM